MDNCQKEIETAVNIVAAREKEARRGWSLSAQFNTATNGMTIQLPAFQVVPPVAVLEDVVASWVLAAHLSFFEMADQVETEKWNAIMPTTQELGEIMTSIESVFLHFSQPDGFRAERLGEAMQILGMSPTEEEDLWLQFLGRLGKNCGDELIKHFEQVQVLVDQLKQYDKDGKGRERQEELQASVAKVPSNSQGHLDIVELAKCFLELGDSQADKTDAEKCHACKDTQAAEDSVQPEESVGPAGGPAYSALFNQIMASTDAVFKYFSKPSGAVTFSASCSMVQEELGKPIPKVQELLDYLKQFDKDGKGSELSQDKVQALLLPIGLACGHTCMSHIERLATALSGLAEAIRGIANELRQVRGPATPIHQEPSLPGDWELIEDQAAVPGAPANFNSSIRFAVEDGPPDTPDFCISLARRKLRSARHSPEERARAAFVAGFWYRISVIIEYAWASDYEPVLPPSTWLVSKGSGISDFARTNSRKEAERFCEDQEGGRIVERFPSVTELQIFCAGAQIPVPPLVQWTKRN
eukprot:s1903_g19.t1